ncbi:hypothetical protein B0H67DRAFT_638786 [Lasiosphaeris hirsuta]|uniref:Uncharacterized protein n=1 Tax=Lasiosphaeris hirsuta TaxID=260670 RepID=A0AA40EAN3_9PEZI|nr:hypothetical protein B0H67DRAFT_638786 [Lasiosphaeris hirsuta]
MANLQREAASVRQKVKSAEQAVTGLESDAQRDITDSLWQLSAAMSNSSRAIEHVLERHKKRHLGLAMFQSGSKKALKLQSNLDLIIQGFRVAVDKAAQLTGSNVSHTQSQLDHDLKATTLQKEAKRRLDVVEKDFAAKELVIQSTEKRIEDNRSELNQADDYESDANTAERRSQNLSARISSLQSTSALLEREIYTGTASLAIDKGGRDEMMRLLGETAEQLQRLEYDVGNKRTAVLQWK